VLFRAKGRSVTAQIWEASDYDNSVAPTSAVRTKTGLIIVGKVYWTSNAPHTAAEGFRVTKMGIERTGRLVSEEVETNEPALTLGKAGANPIRVRTKGWPVNLQTPKPDGDTEIEERWAFPGDRPKLLSRRNLHESDVNALDDLYGALLDRNQAEVRRRSVSAQVADSIWNLRAAAKHSSRFTTQDYKDHTFILATVEAEIGFVRRKGRWLASSAKHVAVPAWLHKNEY